MIIRDTWLAGMLGKGGCHNTYEKPETGQFLGLAARHRMIMLQDATARYGRTSDGCTSAAGRQGRGSFWTKNHDESRSVNLKCEDQGGPGLPSKPTKLADGLGLRDALPGGCAPIIGSSVLPRVATD